MIVTNKGTVALLKNNVMNLKHMSNVIKVPHVGYFVKQLLK